MSFKILWRNDVEQFYKPIIALNGFRSKDSKLQLDNEILSWSL